MNLIRGKMILIDIMVINILLQYLAVSVNCSGIQMLLLF